MAHALTRGAHFRNWISASSVRVGVRLDHVVPGSHLIWNVENVGTQPITLTKLVVRGVRVKETTVVLQLPHVLAPHDQFVLPTDVDWEVLAAESAAFVDADGREYPAPKGLFADVREQLRAGIDRTPSLSAGDFLSGAAELAFGIAILGLGFFMLMYAIATG